MNIILILDECCGNELFCSTWSTAPTKSSVSSSTSNKETLETAEKTIKPPAIKQQEIKEYEDNIESIDTEKYGVSASSSFCGPCCARVTREGNRNLFLKRGRSVTSVMSRAEGGGGRNLGTLLGLGNVNCTSWLRVVLKKKLNCQYCIPIVSTV